MLTELHLALVMPHCSHQRRESFLPHLNAAMAKYKIDNLPRAAAFLAQLAHESCEFQFMEEIWGPTKQQRRYSPPSTLATSLGNINAADGKLFKGRGPIQITGRANYEKYGKLLGLDLVANPQLAAMPEHAFEIAALYWTKNGLNALADAGDFRGITRRINGGLTGLPQREAYYRRAKDVLAGAFPALASKPVQAKAKSTAAPQFTRGSESIPAREPVKHPALDARADTMDFRDLMYTPSLVEVPSHIPLGDYLEHEVPVLDQGAEGACTGYGLATVANYLLRRRRVEPDPEGVSARMFYRLARRYDEWPGENYSGSSARGAMKGWHKHGVCSENCWPSRPKKADPSGLNPLRTADARHRPLGAYFRVNHKDLIAMHSAIAEVGVLYATASVHEGWDDVDETGTITQSDKITGGHAFAIVAYDEQGFWIQNSWGTSWGRQGFGRISYDDWLENGTDVWVARLGAPVVLRQPEATAHAHARTALQSATYSYADLRPHIVSVGNNGELKAGGDYGSTPVELEHVFANEITHRLNSWKRPRILLYAHGGLVSEQSAVQRLAEYRASLLESEVYPIAFIWHTDFWTTIGNILQDSVRRRRPEGVLDGAKDFMLDRLDDALEPLARLLTGKACWSEMKENAFAASVGTGAAVLVADHLKKLAAAVKGLEIHLVAHSAGSIFHAPLLKLLSDRKLAVETCTLWAPACTVDVFQKHYVPRLRSKDIRKFALFALRDDIERDDDCAGIYHKSLLYLVSNAFEATPRVPVFHPDGTPLLGMQRYLDKGTGALIKSLGGDIVYSPNSEPEGSHDASEALHHGDFDDDRKTVTATFTRVIRASAERIPEAIPRSQLDVRARDQVETPMFHRSGSSLREQRQKIDSRTQLAR